MSKVIGPWNVQYPVNFVSHGDTVRAAFGKHINEIERIYGLLSGLGAAKIEAEDLTAAMTANKNEWTTAIAAEKSARESAIAAEKSARESAIAAEVTARSNGDVALGRRIDGLTFGNIGGALGLDRTTGNLPSSRVDGITLIEMGEKYIRFSNGYQICNGIAGELNVKENEAHNNMVVINPNFLKPFINTDYSFVCTLCPRDSTIPFVITERYNQRSVNSTYVDIYALEDKGRETYVSLNYIVIGRYK